MIKITLIFGEGAVRKYDESKELPSQEWLLDNGGVVDEKAFRTEAEYNAYVAGVNDADGWTDYRIIRHKDEPEDTDTSHEEAVWLRLGVTVQGRREEIEKILEGDTDTLRKLLEAGRYEINGETYIPGTAIEEYNAKHRTNFDAKDIDSHISV